MDFCTNFFSQVVERVNTIMNNSISYRLTVNNARQDDSGLYTCISESAHKKHTTTKEVTLIVSQPGIEPIHSIMAPYIGYISHALNFRMLTMCPKNKTYEM